MKTHYRLTLQWFLMFAFISILFATPVMAEGVREAPKIGEPAPSAIKLSESNRVLASDNINHTFELRIDQAAYSGDIYYGIPQQVDWRASSDLVVLSPDPMDPSRCTVSVAGSQLGACSVEARCGSASASCKIVVQRTIPVRKISLSKSKATLYIGSDGPRSTLQLTAQLSPSNASAKNASLGLLEWRSSKESRASVDENGLVTLKGLGSVTIRSVLTDGSKKQVSCKLTIKPVLPNSIRVSPMKLSVGERQVIEAIILPADALDKRLSYQSSNTKVAKVAKDGTVTGIKPGKAVITCTTKSGKRKAKCTVTVAKQSDIMLSTQSSQSPSGPSGSSGAAPRYFFYGIGNAVYPEPFAIPSALIDVNRMNQLYAQAQFSGASVKRTVETNLSASDIEKLLGDMATKNGVTQNDVSIFYYSGLAMPPMNEMNPGALIGSNPLNINDRLSVDRMCGLLDRVPGKVVVILECSLSAQHIAGTVSPANAKAFERSVIQSFASSKATNYTFSAKGVAGGADSKYKVLTACGEGEYPNVMPGDDDDCGLFTMAIASGLADPNPADTDQNGKTTLHELYRYTKDIVSANAQLLFQTQNVCAWPDNDPFVVYSRN